MKRRVELSTWSVILTLITAVLLCALSVYCFLYVEIVFGITIAVMILAMFVPALFYMPVSISVDNHNVGIHRPLRIKEIPLAEITTVEYCPPTMGEYRICASGGFLGYWGLFGERSIGRYFAYYGRASETFLLTLKNGRKYMLGCRDAALMAETIKNRLGN